MMRVLSLGAGVQSTTVLLMSLTGEIEPFDHAIFADTHWEPAAVYEHLTRVIDHAAAHGLPVHVVTAGSLKGYMADPDRVIKNPVQRPDWKGRNRVIIPVYTRNADGTKGMVQRHCTRNYKIDPQTQFIRREIFGLKPRQRWPKGGPFVDQSFGISWDESERMSTPKRPDVFIHSYPLVDRRMTRDGCHKWMAAHGWSAPRSACITCPFHSDDEWRALTPAEWGEAVAYDHELRERFHRGELALNSEPYLHAARVPLDQVILADRPGSYCEAGCGT